MYHGIIAPKNNVPKIFGFSWQITRPGSRQVSLQFTDPNHVRFGANSVFNLWQKLRTSSTQDQPNCKCPFYTKIPLFTRPTKANFWTSANANFAPILFSNQSSLKANCHSEMENTNETGWFTNSCNTCTFSTCALFRNTISFRVSISKWLDAIFVLLPEMCHIFLIIIEAWVQN